MIQTHTQTTLIDAFIALFRMLPEEVQEKLKKELVTRKALRKAKPKGSIKQINKFQKYLLTWPEMSDEEFNFIEGKRKHFNQWK